MHQRPNERCGCRSGKKYKRCCANKPAAPEPEPRKGAAVISARSPAMMLALLTIAMQAMNDK